MKIFTKGCLVAVLFASQFAGFAAEAMKGDAAVDISETGADPARVEAVAHLSSVDHLAHTAFVSVAEHKKPLKKTVSAENLAKPSSLLKGAVESRPVSGGGVLQTPAGSLLKEKNSPTLSAYPNPTRGVTTLSLSQIGNDNYKIRISNTIGKIVRTIDLSDLTDSAEITLDLSHLPSGIYFYSLLVNEKMIETKRLVLQR